MATIFDVANYFLAFQDSEQDITHLKLQKLCAYAQAICVSLLDRPLFMENLIIRSDGVISPDLFQQYAKFGDLPLPSSNLSEESAREPFDDECKFIIDLVHAYYARYAGWYLSNRAKCDFPEKLGLNGIIDLTDLKEAFKNDPLVVRFRDELPDKLSKIDFETIERNLVDESCVLQALNV